MSALKHYSRNILVRSYLSKGLEQRSHLDWAKLQFDEARQQRGVCTRAQQSLSLVF